ncbi:hypothetical protein AB1Y20_001274 [Prymnesium parvum]|uniref:HAT C-terminal dimerisation domain-containing protein n=1 Tax=Prymnesium parvum TaxID=97485 RepID=A0AB34KBK5_PRYPA
MMSMLTTLRWKHMAREVYKVYEDEDGLLNEFRMMFELRKQFPLHYIIFKQCAVHLPHEANVESIFSLAGRVADPNMDSRTLQLLVRVNFNKKNYMPSVKEIRERYFRKYRKSGDLLDEKADNSSDPGENATLQVEDE